MRFGSVSAFVVPGRYAPRFGRPTGDFRMQSTAAVLPKTRAGKLQGDRFHALHGWLGMAASGIRSNDPLLANRIPALMSLDSAGLTASGDGVLYPSETRRSPAYAT